MSIGFETGDITFFVYREKIYDLVIKESFDFFRGGPILQAIALFSLVVMSHVEINVQHFLFVSVMCRVTTVLYDRCGW